MLYVLEDKGARDYQEDRHVVELNIQQDVDFLGVFDGHGGYKVSQFLKTYMKEILRKELATTSDPVEVLLNTFKKTSDSIPVHVAKETGSTAVVLLRKGNAIYVANVGDSRCVMNNRDGAVQLSEDHKPGTEKEYNRIRKLGGHVLNIFGVPRVNGNLAVSRSFGDLELSPYVTWQPEITFTTLNSNNRYIILATDGVWDVFSSEDLIRHVNSIVGDENFSKPLLRKVCNSILEEARKRGSGDNITILFYTIA